MLSQICPILVRLLRSRDDFATSIRMYRVLLALLLRLGGVLVSEAEVFLTILCRSVRT